MALNLFLRTIVLVLDSIIIVVTCSMCGCLYYPGEHLNLLCVESIGEIKIEWTEPVEYKACSLLLSYLL